MNPNDNYLFMWLQLMFGSMKAYWIHYSNSRVHAWGPYSKQQKSK
jgi:hypothetical protein